MRLETREEAAEYYEKRNRIGKKVIIAAVVALVLAAIGAGIIAAEQLDSNAQQKPSLPPSTLVEMEQSTATVENVEHNAGLASLMNPKITFELHCDAYDVTNTVTVSKKDVGDVMFEYYNTLDVGDTVEVELEKWTDENTGHVQSTKITAIR